MELPLNLMDISLWLAIIATILLITSEIILPYTKKAILIERRRLRTVAIIVGLAFTFTVFIRIYQIIIS